MADAVICFDSAGKLVYPNTFLTPVGETTDLAWLQDRFPKANLIGGDSEYEKLVAKVVGFIETPKIGWDLPLNVRGTAFQRRVWKELQKII